MHKKRLFGFVFVGSMAMLTSSYQLAFANTSPSISAVSPSEAASDIAAALYAASATQEAAQRQSGQLIKTQRAEIETLRVSLRTGQENTASSQAELAKLRKDITERESRFVAELSARDRAYAAEISVFRERVEGITSTPEGLAALKRFNSGDKVRRDFYFGRA